MYSFIQAGLFSLSLSVTEMTPMTRKEMGRPETRMADVLHTHRSCNVAKWKDQGMQ